MALTGEGQDRFKLLCEKYRIPPTADGGIDWRMLAIGLAIKHESAILLPQKRGAKNLFRRHAMLILDVERLQQDKPGRSDREAVHIMVKRKRWRGETIKTLLNLLPIARKDKHTLDLIERMRETAREQGWPDMWEMLDRAYQRPLGRVSQKLG
jgi:hypothetical protein